MNARNCVVKICVHTDYRHGGSFILTYVAKLTEQVDTNFELTETYYICKDWKEHLLSPVGWN